MSASAQTRTSSTGADAQAHARAPPQQTVLVSGEARESVNVQSQLATSTVQGDVTSKSNLGQVVQDLSAAHDAHSGWVQTETDKISQWGQAEITRILAQTKGLEEQLIKGAKERQLALDNSHKGELAKIIQQLDLQKAAELKELEDGLQRQIQAALTTSKQEIARIESEMNNKKMDLLKQSQLKSAKEIDALSNLVVETKLTPSVTRTVIETATNTGNVLAVATGAKIVTGAAQAEAYSSTKVAAVPNAGELRQESDVRTGDMVQTTTGRKVGDGAIVNTMTEVIEQRGATGASGPSTLSGGAGAPAVGARPTTSQIAQHQATDAQRSGATQRQGDAVPVDGARVAGSAPQLHDGDKRAYQNPAGQVPAIDGDKHGHGPAAIDAAYGKHSTTDAHHSGGGLMNKVRNALSHGTEPKSSDATKRV